MRFVLSAVVALGLVAPAPAEDAPRRLLFVQVSEYAYLNPLTRAVPGGPDRTRDAATRLATALRVPTHKDNDQLFVLSDSDAPDAPLPTKDAIEKTIAAFADTTTRAKDGVMIYIGAHAVAKDGKAFVVPIDGDPDAPETLVPVADIYARLAKLACVQKVIVWDVCRHNAERVRGRRDTGPMTPELFRALTTPPRGVEALVSCSPGEHSIEYYAPVGPAGLYAGSAYLDALRQAAEDLRAKDPNAVSFLMGELHDSATKSLAAVAKLKGAKQVPAFSGLGPQELLRGGDKDPAKRFELPTTPPASAEAKAVLAELALPPVVGEDIFARLPFAADALKGYAPDVSTEDIFKDVDKYPLRVATLRALQGVRDVWPDRKGQPPIATLPAALTDAVKRPIADAQEPLAKALVRLEYELSELEGLESKRAKEPKRWQAHYDFAVAELRLRVVLLSEYNRALGNARTETLPSLGDGRGWRLVPSDKVTGRKDVRLMHERAVEGFAKLAADHKGTPWAALAKRSQATLPGARWEAVPK